MMLWFRALFTWIILHYGDSSHIVRYRKNGFPGQSVSIGVEQKKWGGAWFPHAPDENAVTSNEITSVSQMKDPKHGVKMGIPFLGCDDGKSNIDVDWNFSSINYTCYTPKALLPMDSGKAPVLKCDKIPKNYMPPHHCMDKKIHYDSAIPTYGGHRPLWPQFGEYIFVPPQRWLHNIEHGSVVMLYHPCTPTVYVDAVKNVVEACIWKHVVTPYNLVPKDTPIVLVAWGCKLELSYVNSDTLNDVVKFIRAYGHHGPEGSYQKQGQYNIGLKHSSQPVPGSNDGKILCPGLP